MALFNSIDNVQQPNAESYYHDYKPLTTIDVMKDDTGSGAAGKWAARTETQHSGALDLSANPYPQQAAEDGSAKLYGWSSIKHEPTVDRVSFGDRSNAKPLDWSNDLFHSFQRAISEGKPLVVEFSQESCPWCNRLNNETMSSDQVRGSLRDAVVCRIDPEKDDDVKGNIAKLQKDLGVDRYPTTLVLDVSKSSIQERGRIVGYFEPMEYSRRLNGLMKPEAPTLSSSIAA